MRTIHLTFPRVFILAFLILALSACTPRQGARMPEPPPVPEPQVDGKAAQIWNRFATRAGTAEIMTGPFRISASLRYTDASEKNTRVSALLWGNGKAESPYPLRLDLLAGIGSVVAKVREDANTFTAYIPDENTAYIPPSDIRTLSSFGVPIPLSLGDLTLLLTGRSGALFLPSALHNDQAVPQEHALTDKGARYTVPDARLPGVLELSSAGAPLAWRETNPDGWAMEIEPDSANPLLPRRLRISHARGHSALIVVKEISRVSPPYSSAQMELTLPPGVERRASLEQ